MSDHKHRLTRCHECDDGLRRYLDGWPICESCEGRGYYERCEVCGEPMGNARRRWKRQQGGDTEGDA